MIMHRFDAFKNIFIKNKICKVELLYNFQHILISFMYEYYQKKHTHLITNNRELFNIREKG